MAWILVLLVGLLRSSEYCESTDGTALIRGLVQGNTDHDHSVYVGSGLQMDTYAGM